MKKLNKILASAMLISVAPLSMLFTGCSMSGASAYDIAVQNGFKGSEKQWLESLKGEKGDKGLDGRGIVNITKTETEGLVDTYTITFTSGEPTTFKVTNGASGEAGRGVQNVELEMFGPAVIYKITYSDEETESIAILDGQTVKLTGTPSTRTDGFRTVYVFPAAEGNVEIAEEGVLASESFAENAKAVVSEIRANIYNKTNNKIDSYTEFTDYVKENYFVPFLDLGREVDVQTLTFGSTTYTNDQEISLSVGNNSHIKSPVFKFENNILSVAAPVLALEASENNYITLNINSQDQISHSISSMSLLQKYNLDQVKPVSGATVNKQGDSTYDIEITAGSGSIIFGVDGLTNSDSGYSALTKKTYSYNDSSKNTTEFGFTLLSDNVNNYFGIQLYPAGWNGSRMIDGNSVTLTYKIYLLDNSNQAVGEMDSLVLNITYSA